MAKRSRTGSLSTAILDFLINLKFTFPMALLLIFKSSYLGNVDAKLLEKFSIFSFIYFFFYLLYLLFTFSFSR